MKIVSLETLRPAFQPNVTLVRLTDDTGAVGLGETFFAAGACEAYLHENVAPVLLGMADPAPERVAVKLAPYVGYQGGGVETRCCGAVDIALWDLHARRAGKRVVDLLGGAVRDRIRIYNTCAGSGYVSTSSRQELSNWGLGRKAPYEDLDAFLNRPGELARELWAEGIPGMKVWPFDPGAEKTHGAEIFDVDLARGVGVVAAIREAVPQMDLMVELHGLWNLKTAEKICNAVAPFDPFWVEDPLRPDAVDDVALLAGSVGVRLAMGETVVGRRGFLPLLQRNAVGVITADVQWTGGLTEARAIAELARGFNVPVAPHDCTGPITFAACVHLVLSRPNGLIQETVRAFLRTWYGELVEGLPPIADGHVSTSKEPGLGLRLKPGLEERSDVKRRISRL